MLHETSSTNELRVRSDSSNRISFYPYFVMKDTLTTLYALFALGILVFNYPEVFNHSVNYIMADMMVTPSHIVPEWYFPPYYAISRSILDKTIGICAMLLAIVMFHLLPVIDCGSGQVKLFGEAYRMFYWFFVLNFVLLGFLGSETAEYPCVEFGTFFTLFYLVSVSSVPPTFMLDHTIFLLIRK